MISSISKVTNLEQPQTNGSPPLGIGVLMERFFGELDEAKHRPGVPSALESLPDEPDFAEATSLIARAAQAFETMMERCQTLERKIEVLSKQAKANEAAQGDTIGRLEQIASMLKDRVDAAEAAIKPLQLRCQAAEARAGRAESRATVLEQTATRAIAQAAQTVKASSKLHADVIRAFGKSSPAYLLLDPIEAAKA